MISQEDISDYLTKANTVNSIVEFELGSVVNIYGSFKRYLIELKVQVDRWDLISAYFVLNPSLKPMVKNLLAKSCDIDVEGNIKIWGQAFYFSEAMPLDNILCVSTLKYNDYRNVALGILPSNKIQRFLNLKVFW